MPANLVLKASEATASLMKESAVSLSAIDQVERVIAFPAFLASTYD
jgi:hypothetical protein